MKDNAEDRSFAYNAGDLPLVGVVIPCFNQGHFAADSVGSVLDQEYPHWKAVLLDDASTDGRSPNLCRTLQSPRVKVVCLEQNLGRSLIRNHGVAELGDVDYVLMLDCDDRLSPTYVARLVDVLEADRTLGLAYGTLHAFGETTGEAASGTWPQREWCPELMYLENVIPGPGTMFRRQALTETDGWREAFNHSGAEDFDISLQVLEQGWKPAWVRGAVFHYRKHAASSLATKSEERFRLVDLNILEHHLLGIRRNCGAKRFLRPRMLPFLLSAVRHKNLPLLRRFLPPLMLLSAGSLLTLFAAYYFRRFAALIHPPKPRTSDR